MSKYTTGEMARLCGVTVRTVQYYDTRGILIPSELSEGGRRLYSEDDLKRMKIVCFLRELGLPIGVISQILSEDHLESTISLLLEQQELQLRAEINESQRKVEGLKTLKRELKSLDTFTVESIGDIADLMKNKNKLKKIHTILLVTGIPFAIAQLTSIILWIVTGIWWPFVCYLFVSLLYAALISKYYFKRVAYICPKCHNVFKPAFKEAFFARHTPNTRKLTCTCCNHHGFCVETYGGEAK